MMIFMRFVITYLPAVTLFGPWLTGYGR